MSGHIDSIQADAENSGSIGIGSPLQRLEDQRFLTGTGRYVDDISPQRVAIAYVVRSPHGHARIVRIDKRAALASPGVIAILTGGDVLADGLEGLPCSSFPKLVPGSVQYCPTQPILVADKVRHVGDRVALIVAESLAEAKDAGELLDVEYDPLPAVTLEDALAAKAPKIWDDAPSNISFEREFGDARAVAAKFAEAYHVCKISIHYPCASANAIEPRATLGYFDPTDRRYTLYSSTQMPFRVKDILCDVLHIAQLDLRVKAVDVGGAFGMKGQIYPEDALVVWAAGKVRRPVKWTADRNESIASDMHGRSQIADAELAFDEAGKILAFRTVVAVDLGAYLGQSAGIPPSNAGLSYPGTYHVPLIHATVRAVFTNTAQLGPYRGSGKPEASFVLERLMEKAAREMGIDPIDLRRRNLIQRSQMPYKTPGVYTYDTGDFEAILNQALALSNWDGFEERKQVSAARGFYRGIGLSMHCQRAGTANERMEIRVDPMGSVSVYAGTFATGQGHETMYAQLVSEWLGVSPLKVRVFQGDTDTVLYGRGTFAQRSMSAGGSALKAAAENVVVKGKKIAAWILEAAEADIQFNRGTFSVVGTDRRLSFAEVASKSYNGLGVPEELGVGLDGIGSHSGANTYPNGCIVCEVEIDIDTGMVSVDRLTAVDDVGAVINPITLEGQLHGSVAQGLGEALVEEVIYEKGSAQLLTGSLMDYGMPRADMVPNITSEVTLVRSNTNPLGSKGGSEAGNVGVPAAVVNAILDALSPFGVSDIAIPATPERVWRAIMNGTNSR